MSLADDSNFNQPIRIEPSHCHWYRLTYAISKLCGSLIHAKKLILYGQSSFGLLLVVFQHLLQHTGYSTPTSVNQVAIKLYSEQYLAFMLTLTGLSIMFRGHIERFFNKFRQANTQDDMTSDLENVNFQAKNKRLYIVIMGIVLGIFVTLSSVGAGAFGIMALVLMFPNLPMIRIIGSDVVHAVLLTFVAGMGHMTSGNVDFHLLGWLLCGSIPAIIVGTLISSRLPEKLIRKILGITLFALGVNFMINPVKAKPVAKPGNSDDDSKYIACRN